MTHEHLLQPTNCQTELTSSLLRPCMLSEFDQLQSEGKGSLPAPSISPWYTLALVVISLVIALVRLESLAVR